MSADGDGVILDRQAQEARDVVPTKGGAPLGQKALAEPLGALVDTNAINKLVGDGLAVVVDEVVAGDDDTVGQWLDIVLAKQVKRYLPIFADGREHHVFAAKANNLLVIGDVKVFVREADVVRIIEAVGNKELGESIGGLNLRIDLLERLVDIAQLVVIDC